MKKYGKEILAESMLTIDDNVYHCLIVDDKDYYNIHIITDKYRDDEMNTLQLQEPKECVKLEDISTKEFMLARIAEFALWDLCYGDGDKLYSFSVKFESVDL